MRLHKIMRLVAAAGLMAGAAGMAQAESSFQSGTGSLTATVAAQCMMSTAANDLNFGTVPTSAGTVTGSTAFGVTCTNGTP